MTGLMVSRSVCGGMAFGQFAGFLLGLFGGSSPADYRLNVALLGTFSIGYALFDWAIFVERRRAQESKDE